MSISMLVVDWWARTTLTGNINAISWVSQVLNWSPQSRCSGPVIRAVGLLDPGPGNLDKLLTVCLVESPYTCLAP